MNAGLGKAGRGFGWRMALAGAVVVALLAAIVIPLTDANTRRTSLIQFEQSLAEQAEIRGEGFFAGVDRLAADALFLSKTPPIQGIIRATRNAGTDPLEHSTLPQWKQRLTAIFEAFADSNPDVMQVRYIGVADQGLELVRVDRRDGRVGVIPQGELQAKGGRDYFQEAVHRRPGDVYVSDINLNREYGAVEVPHVPTLRVATPVYDSERRLFGMIVINKSVRRALDELSYQGDFGIDAYLMNAEGDYLANPDRGKTFGFDLGRRYRWQDDFRPTGEAIRSGAAATGPRLQTLAGPDGVVHAVLRTFAYDAMNPGRYLTVATVVPDSVVAAQVTAARGFAMIAMVAVAAIVAFCLVLITIAVSRREEAYLNEAYLAAIVASTTDAVIGLDLRGRISSWNAAAERMFGFSSDEALGEAVATLSVPPDRRDEAGELLTRIRDGETIAPFDTVRLRRDGTRLDVSVSVSPIRTGEGDIVGAAEVVRDITEQKAAQARILELNSTLEQQVEERTRELVAAKGQADAANRAKSEFLANMSHEIRTPMNAVLGMLQLLGRTELSEQQCDYVDRADSAASALLEIINDILDFSKIEAGRLVLDPRPFVISRLLREVGIVIGGTVGGKDLEVLFDVDPQLPAQLVGDSQRIKQVLINLLGNAVKFTERGEVVLTVRLEDEDADSVRVHFAVRDTGIGLSPEQQKRIFEAFVQADAATTRRYGGTGLGLVICQRLIALHGGELMLESAPEQGSTFSFTLSLGRVSAEQSATLAERSGKELEGLRILIVDDNDDARLIIGDMAGSLGWIAETAASHAQALERVAASVEAGTPYDVVLLDRKLPDQDGWQAAEDIKKMLAGSAVPPLVMVSAYPHEALAQGADGERSRIDGFLTKPLTASDLFDAVAMSRSGLERSRAARQRPPPGMRLAGMRVLVVEDNAANQQVARELLASEGAEVTIAGDGQHALDTLGSAAAPFDVVLMDVQMPRVDGYAATRKIRSELKLKDLPVVAMTANVMAGDVQECLQAGMNAHIGKPLDFEQLVATVLAQTGREEQPASVRPELRGGPLPESPPGFDLPAALERLGCNRMLYAQQARAFAEHPPVRAARLREMIRAGDRKGAAAALHTLRGVAGTLGARALAETLRSAEVAAQAASDPEALEPVLEQIETQLEDVREALRQLADQLAAAAPPPPPPAPGAAVASDLAAFDELLADSNMRALDVFEGLKARVPSLGALDGAMAALDFEGARRRLAQLREEVVTDPAAEGAGS